MKSLTWVWLSITLWGCEGKFELITSKLPRDADIESCGTNCPYVQKIAPFAAKAGTQIRLTGEGFVNELKLVMGDQSYPLSIISKEEAYFEVPEGKPGRVSFALTVDDEIYQQDAAFYRLDPSIPMVTAGADFVCSGESFYNAKGELKVGQRVCEKPPLPCTKDGQVGCLSTDAFPSVMVAGLGAKVVLGQQVAGVAGQIAVFPPCESDGATSCVVDGEGYVALEASKLNPAHIKKGISFAGVVGDYPSENHPLPGASALSDLDEASYFARIKSDNDFEYWTSAGIRQEGQGDEDISIINLRQGVSVFGTTGIIQANDCLYADESSCEADAACVFSGGACGLNPLHIRYGITIQSKTGVMKTNCRNPMQSSLFNADNVPPGNSGVTTGVTLDWWDTIDLSNADADLLPNETVDAFSLQHQCGPELWQDVTADGACDSGPEDCLIKDLMTGLIFSEGFPVTGASSTDQTKDWSQAVSHCEDLDFGGKTNWRLPTQMELMVAYTHGLRGIGFKGGTPRPQGDTLQNNDYFISEVDTYFWSASSKSNDPTNAWIIYLHDGTTYNFQKANPYRLICVSE